MLKSLTIIVGFSVFSFNSVGFPSLIPCYHILLYNISCWVSCLWNEFCSYHHPLAKPTPHNLFCHEIITCQGTNFSMSPSRLSASTLQKLQRFKVYFMLMSQSNVCCQEKGSCPHSHSAHWLFLWVSSHFLITSESAVDSSPQSQQWISWIWLTTERKECSIADKVFGVWALKGCISLYLCSIGTQLLSHCNWRKKPRNVDWLCDQEEKKMRFGAM